MTEIPERKHKTEQLKTKVENLEKAHRERCRTRKRERMTKINFPQTGECFITKDMINSQMSEMAKRMKLWKAH